MLNVFYFDLNKIDFEEAYQIFQNIKEVLPEGDQLVGLPNGTNLIQDADITYLYHLRNTIDEAIEEAYRKDYCQ